MRINQLAACPFCGEKPERHDSVVSTQSRKGTFIARQKCPLSCLTVLWQLSANRGHARSVSLRITEWF